MFLSWLNHFIFKATSCWIVFYALSITAFLFLFLSQQEFEYFIFFICLLSTSTIVLSFFYHIFLLVKPLSFLFIFFDLILWRISFGVISSIFYVTFIFFIYVFQTPYADLFNNKDWFLIIFYNKKWIPMIEHSSLILNFFRFSTVAPLFFFELLFSMEYVALGAVVSTGRSEVNTIMKPIVQKQFYSVKSNYFAGEFINSSLLAIN